MAQPRRATLFVWSVLALLNLGAGILLASRPDRASDLATMQRWGKEWLVDGANIYALEGEAPAYPPHGIVALSPLGLVPSSWVVPVWATLNLALAVLAPYLAVRAFDPTMRPAGATLPILMFLCWGPFRTLLQFSLLTFLLGLLALLLADRRPVLAGLFLGLALAKPQVAVPFFCWSVFSRRIRIAAIAIVVVCAGWVLFCVRAHVSPVSVVQQYRQHLQILYTGDELLIGASHLRPLIRLAVSDSTLVDVADASIAFAIFGALCLMGFTEGRRTRAVTFSAPPLVALWSLLTFYHLTYGFLLLLPTAVLLVLSREPETRHMRAILFWTLQALIMVDVPGLWRRLGRPDFLPHILDAVIPHVDRALVLVMFTGVAVLYLRSRGERSMLGAEV